MGISLWRGSGGVPQLYFSPLSLGREGEVNGDIGTPKSLRAQRGNLTSVPRNDMFSSPVIMLNLFQHLSFQCINLEIPKQVRNCGNQVPLSLQPLRAARKDSGKGSPEGFPSGGGLGVSPQLYFSPLSLRRGGQGVR